MNSLNPNKYILNEKLSFFTGISFSVHVFILLIFLIVSKLNFSNKKLKIITVEPIIRVDVVAMPKFTIQELKKLSGGSTSATAEITEIKPIINETGPKFLKKKRSILDMLKSEAQKKIKKTTYPTKKEKKIGKSKGNGVGTRLSKNARNALKNLVIQGNKISHGKALTGKGGSALIGEFNEYIVRLPDLVKPNWKLPSYLLDKGFNCRIRIYISPDGNLLKSEIYESSGDGEYDKKALEAIRESSFPVPNKNIKNDVLDGKIILGFPL